MALTQDPGVFIISQNDIIVENKYKYKLKMDDKEEKSAKTIFLYKDLMYGLCVIT